MRTINRGLGSSVFRQYGMGESGRTAREVQDYITSISVISTQIEVPQFITVNGIRGELLFGLDGLYLTSRNGIPLYGRSA